MELIHILVVLFQAYCITELQTATATAKCMADASGVGHTKKLSMQNLDLMQYMRSQYV